MVEKKKILVEVAIALLVFVFVAVSKLYDNNSLLLRVAKAGGKGRNFDETRAFNIVNNA